ncbi:hypothetical protein MFAL_39250 [Mycolicibacterium fallax]|nr:hypothetical protein MFAL_39250 [Mycolicibacterium fallax]
MAGSGVAGWASTGAADDETGPVCDASGVMATVESLDPHAVRIDSSVAAIAEPAGEMRTHGRLPVPGKHGGPRPIAVPRQ